MIEARSITVRFGETVALADVSLAPPVDRTTVLIGPSGCGKSTLLRAFIGLIAPASGDVLFDGAALDPARLRDVRTRVGYVIQEGGLFPHLTAHANVTLMARQLGRDDAARVDELAALARLEPALLDRYPSELSGGQRQRVSLMRALMLDPAVLLLDEPLAALDPLVRAELQRDLKAIFRELRKTVVIVTHDLAEAAHFADEVVLLRDGRIEQQGPFRQLVEAPASNFAREFVSAQKELHTV